MTDDLHHQPTNGEVQSAEQLVELQRQYLISVFTDRIGTLDWPLVIGWPLPRTAATTPRSRPIEREIALI